MTQSTAFFPLGGGLDLVTPEIQKPPGHVIAGLNYVPLANGYGRIKGYERFNGQAAPSNAANRVFYLPFFNGTTAGVGSVVAGTRLDTHQSGALGFGVAVDVPRLSTGSYAGGDATGCIPIVLHLGSWAIGDPIGINGAPPIANASAASGNFTFVGSGFYTSGENTAHKAAAAAVARGDIYPPGEGPGVSVSGKPITGVWSYGGNVYAFRDFSDGTRGVMYLGAIGRLGWGALALGLMLSFNTGTSEPTSGTVTGATSGATAAFIRTFLQSGSWAGGNAAGYFIVSGQTGHFTAGENLQISGVTKAHAVGDSVQGALPPGGAYEFLNKNFFGASNLEAMFGVNGVGKAFMYHTGDTALTFITTGMAVDTPDHVAEHKNSLFLSFPGGSIQFSQVGNPGAFSAVLGAGEIGVGSDVTGIISGSSDALAIFSKTSVNILTGSSSANYALATLSLEAGGLRRTAQRLGQVVYMDNSGLRTLNATQAFGNFTLGSLTRLIAPLLTSYRDNAINPVCSWVNRTDNQYWVLFSDGTGLVVLMERKNPEVLPVKLGFIPTCACSVEIGGVQRIFVGGSNGYVYEFGKGTSFDGAAIESYIRLPFWSGGAPKQNKRLDKAAIELLAAGSTSLTVSADINYGLDPGLSAVTATVSTGGGAITGLGSNEAYFAAQIETVADAYLSGVGRSFSLKISGSTATEQPHVLTGVTYHFSPRGLQR